MRCQVCHERDARGVFAHGAFALGAKICGPECGATVRARALAYRQHRASRTNDWPTSVGWRRFASWQADCDMGGLRSGLYRERYYEFPYEWRELFLRGLHTDAVIREGDERLPAYRLGVAYRRRLDAIRERRAG